MDIAEYCWWGSGGNEPPPNLKTKKQLSEMGLSPIAPVGVIHTRKYYLYLYDSDNPQSVKPKRQCSPKQLENLAKQREKQGKIRRYREWYESWGKLEIDRVDAVKTAKNYLENKSVYVILDTETTGLNEAEIVEIAIIDLDGKTLLNTLVKPRILIPSEVIKIHGITNEMVADSPSFPEVYYTIVDVLKDKTVLIWNRQFDISILNYCRNIHKLPSFRLSDRSECLMEIHAQWYGEWSTYWHKYKWQPLCSEHRALSDCLAALNVIKIMAADSDTIEYPEGVEPLDE
ncbi:putative exonuclease CP81 (plasmid) [Planktothrix tepida]|uniref:3'-5' exonuclease n=2 Tax=Planktothrix tepida TaxID=1678309 RepID=UPI0020B3D40D|nr:3'-5' exonuclease [Planktothrix tepida]CAD5988604.1 putative exonuclease CP81 [Planktothrix tepida]